MSKFDDIPLCVYCGGKAHYNLLGKLTCESCAAEIFGDPPEGTTNYDNYRKTRAAREREE